MEVFMYSSVLILWRDEIMYKYYEFNYHETAVSSIYIHTLFQSRIERLYLLLNKIFVLFWRCLQRTHPPESGGKAPHKLKCDKWLSQPKAPISVLPDFFARSTRYCGVSPPIIEAGILREQRIGPPLPKLRIHAAPEIRLTRSTIYGGYWRENLFCRHRWCYMN